MKNKITAYLEEVAAFGTDNLEQLEAFRLKFLSKKGIIPSLFSSFKQVAPQDRKEMGQLINTLKQAVQNKIVTIKEQIESKSDENVQPIDMTLPTEDSLGSRHPLSIVRNEIIEIFARIGFNVSEGPEVEDDFHNFTALNFPEEHPARDMQDTFFIE